MIAEKTKKKNSKTQRVFDTQLLALNAMSDECKAYKADLHELSTAITKELRENLFQLINTYLITELELQLSKNKLNSAAANNSLTQQSIVPVPETTVVSNLPDIKCVIVGDGMTGKSYLCARFIHESELPYIPPTIFETYSTDFTVDGVRYNLTLWDTAGREEYDRLRPLSYTNADVVLICFKFPVAATRENVANQWIPEVRQHCPKTPIVLVNTSSNPHCNSTDKRESFDFEDGMRLAKQYDADTYVECPFFFSKEDTNAVFEAAVRAAVKGKLQSAQDKKPRSALDKFKLIFAGRRTNVR
jgi:small GTP-binding protein